MSQTIRELNASDSAAASALALASFDRFIAGGWSAAASIEYRSLVSTSALASSIESCAYAAGVFEERTLLGFLLMPRPSLIQMFFVDPDRMREGLGRILWLHARNEVEVRFPEVKTIELNASSYAVEFYRSIGFVPISKEFESRGFRATRMACWLAARALGAELR